MPTLTVYQPPNNLVVSLNQPFLVTGQATDRGPPEPVLIDSVTVQVDDGPVIHAALTRVPKRNMTVANFKAFARVTGGQDPHTVTVTATNDSGISVQQTRQVFTGPVFEVDAPAIVVDLLVPFPIDLSDPKTKSWLSSLTSSFQNALVPLSQSLAANGMIVAGPNFAVGTDPDGRQVLRLGVWIEGSTFPVIAAAPPDFPLPRLSDEATAAGFATVPVQLAPDLVLPDPPALPGPSFALRVTTGALQHLLDAVLPAVRSAASQSDVSVSSITVQTSSPGSVTTSLAGKLPLNVGFTATITEVLGTAPIPDSEPPQAVPAVIGNSHSASVGSLLDWIIGVLIPIFGLLLAAAFGIFSLVVSRVAGQLSGIAAALIAGIPSRIPFQNTALPPLPFSLPIPDFPVLIPNWRSFGADSSGIVGSGTTIIAPRTQSGVGLTISGAEYIPGYQEDLAGGAGQTYSFGLVDLVPDTDKFNWQVSGAASRHGPITATGLALGGSFAAFFPLSLRVRPGVYPFTLTANATETCGSDSTKALSASASLAVRVEVKPNPKVPP